MFNIDYLNCKVPGKHVFFVQRDDFDMGLLCAAALKSSQSVTRSETGVVIHLDIKRGETSDIAKERLDLELAQAYGK